MKLKQLITIVAVICLVSVAALWWTRPREKEQDSADLTGRKLLSSEILQQATRIELSDSVDEEVVVLEKGTSGEWFLPDYHGFKADFSKLENITRNLLQADVTRFVTRNPERIVRLELGKTRIVLGKSEGDPLWTLEIGKRGSSGGAFVRVDDGDDTFLATLSVFIDATLRNWPDKKLLPFTPDDVSSVSVEFPGPAGPLAFARTSATDIFVLTEPREDKIANDQEVKQLLNTLVNARFLDVKELDDPDAMDARDHTRRLDFKLFNGDGYTLMVGRRPAEPITPTDAEESDEPETTSEVGVDAERSGNGEDAAAKEPAEPKNTDPGPVFFFYSSANPTHRINRIMENVALTFSSYTFERIFKSVEDVLKEKEAGEALPETPQVLPAIDSP